MPSTDFIEAQILTDLQKVKIAEILKYLVAIDFGSTNSAAAYVRQVYQGVEWDSALDPISLKDIIKIDRYPGPFSSKSLIDEVPTLSRYQDKNLEEWGLEVSERRLPGITARFEYFKILFDKTTNSLPYRQKLMDQIRTLGISEVQLISDYLEKLSHHIRDRIDSKDNSEDKDIHYILTFPPLFDILAEQKIKDAASKAGMVLRPEQCIYSEPKAAAAFFLAQNQALSAEDGDVFVVCDSGGMTQDVAALELVSREPCVLNEVATGESDLCGSIFLDQGFKELVEERLRNVTYLDRKEKELQTEKAVVEFSLHIKTTFEVGEKPISVRIDGLKPQKRRPDLRHNYLFFENNDIVNVFKPVIAKNIAVIKKQIENYQKSMRVEEEAIDKVKFILFVGGMSGSAYVVKALIQEFRDQKAMGYSIPVVVLDQDGATALVQGALLLASQSSTITQIRLRRSYGIEQDEEYNPEFHQRRKVTRDRWENYPIVTKCIRWLIPKGTVVRSRPGHPYVSRSGVLHGDTCLTGPFDFTQNLYDSDTLVQDHLSINSRKEIRKMGELCFDLTSAKDAREEMWRDERYSTARPVSEWEDSDRELTEARSSGKTWYRFSYEVVIHIMGDELNFKVVAPPGPDGKSYSSGQISIAKKV